jgi:Tfp pilus assembly protein PilF
MKKLVLASIASLLVGLVLGAVIHYRFKERMREGSANLDVSLGFKSLDEAKWVDAFTYFHQARALKPEWYQPHVGIGATFQQLKLPALAIEEYQRAVTRIDSHALSPELERAELTSRIGDLEREQHHYKDAVTAYKEAIRFAPEWPNSHLGLARTYLALGEKKLAADSLREYLKREVRPNGEQSRHDAESLLREIDKGE